MHLGSQLYSLSPKELRSAPVLQRVIRREQANVALATVTLNTPPVPLEMIWHLTHLNVYTSSGAAQTTTGWRVEIEDENGNLISELWRNEGGGAVGSRGDAFDLDVLLMPRERLTLDAFFNAGAAANFASLDAIGIFMPRGTIQLR